MSSAAERARQKAEARRQRILSKSADRLGVVTGIVAPSILKEDDGEVATAIASSSSSSSSPTAAAAAAVASSETADVAASISAAAGVVGTTTVSNTTADNGTGAEIMLEESRGARRMAAMRRRRYQQSKSVEKDDDISNANQRCEGSTAAQLLVNISTTLNSNLISESAKIEPILTTEDDDKGVNTKTNQPFYATQSNDVVIPPTIDEKNDEVGQDDEEEHHHHPKKYMGVARIRRQKVKEQKAQRLKDITDAEILGGGGLSSPSRSDLVREITAEIATMDVTASMVRKGGMVVDENTIGKWASAKGFSWNKRSTRRSWKWYASLVLPPMKLIPRLITLLLLFLAGLDLGTQPHRPSSFSSVDTDLAAMTSATDGISSSSLIGYVEFSLTKPWEYGMGGKVAYVVGMTSTSPPTALPTFFMAASDDNYDDDDDDGSILMECDASDEFGRSNKAEWCGDTTSATKNEGRKMKDKNKNAIPKKNTIKLHLMEDEFDSTSTRPRGVVNHHHPHGVASEFDDDDYDPSALINNKIIDPLFQVDLDALLSNAQLPLPIDYAAKFAIGFHRTWVHYLWKLPTSLVKSMFEIPMNLMSGWIANPPWILGVVLLIRFITKVLVGTTSTSSNGKSFSLGPENDEAWDNSSGMMGGGGGNLDVMEKVMDAAKNYASSSFPKLSFVLGTLMQVMKVDMYVLLCGMLIGLVMCSFWSGGSSGTRSNVEVWSGNEVLGGGEF